MDLIVAERAKAEARNVADEARRRAEEDARKAREEEEAKRAAEAVRKAEEDARKAREADEARKAAEEASRKAEEDARKGRETEDARRAAEEEEARKAAAEAARKAEVERKAREEEEARTQEAKRNLDWTFQAKHPTAAEAEKEYILQCAEALSKEVVRAGGLTKFLQPGCEVRWNLLTDDCEADDGDPPGLMMRRCFKAMLRWWAQTGRDTISVFDGHLMGQGEQKFVRMTLLLNGKQHPITVVWNIEVHLE